MTTIAVIVVYNRSIADSPSFRSANAQEDVRVLVLDNSTIESNNQEEAAKADAWYISMHGNAGLSRAYNAAIKFLRNKDYDRIVLLDDDTQVPASYWNTVSKLPRNDSVYLPVVRTLHGDIISPAEMSSGYPRKAKNIELIKTVTGINSGMVIPEKIWSSYKYDENLFLDNVDHLFLRNMHNRGCELLIFESDLTQDFSADTADTRSLLKRFRIFEADTRYFYKDAPWIGQFIIMKRKLRIFMKTKRVGVFRL